MVDGRIYKILKIDNTNETVFRSFNAGVGDDEVVQLVPVAVPHHKSSQGIVVLLYPLPELRYYIGLSIIGRDSCAC